MRSASVVASCPAQTTVPRPRSRRGYAVCALLTVAGLWSFALLPGKTGAAGEKPAVGTRTTLGEALVLAATPELEPLVQRVGREMTITDARLRIVVRTSSVEETFQRMARGEVLGVISPRPMTEQESLILAARNYSVTTFPVLLKPDTLFLSSNGRILSTPPTKQDFLYVYMRGEAVQSRPNAALFARRFQQAGYGLRARSQTVASATVTTNIIP
jgi:hypothetical protein